MWLCLKDLGGSQPILRTTVKFENFCFDPSDSSLSVNYYRKDSIGFCNRTGSLIQDACRK